MAEGSGFAGYGYTDSGGEKIAALIDMINGGGAGRAGQEFEGGGILSLIANLLASPYGSRDRGAASPPGRPAGGAPAPAPAPAQAPVNAPPSPSRQGAPVPADARAPRTLEGIMAASGRTQLPTGGPGTFAPGSMPAAPAARPAPAMPTGGPGTFAPGSMPAASPRPAMPTGGPGTFSPGRLPTARTPAMTGATSAAEMLELESYLASATLPSDPASRDPIGMATIPRIPMGGFLPSEVRNLPAGPDNRGPMASVEGPMLSEMLSAAPPPADSALMGSFPRPDYPVRNESLAESLIRNTPRVPSGGPALAVGDFAGKTPAEVARGVAPVSRPRARPMEFEQFVQSLGSAAEGVSPEILRTAYQNFLRSGLRDSRLRSYERN